MQILAVWKSLDRSVLGDAIASFLWLYRGRAGHGVKTVPWPRLAGYEL